jgi:hypothetical protein
MEENFAEDPFVVSRLGVAALAGLQGRDGIGGASRYLGSPRTHVASQAKHFAMHHLRVISLSIRYVWIGWLVLTDVVTLNQRTCLTEQVWGGAQRWIHTLRRRPGAQACPSFCAAESFD